MLGCKILYNDINIKCFLKDTTKTMSDSFRANCQWPVTNLCNELHVYVCAFAIQINLHKQPSRII